MQGLPDAKKRDFVNGRICARRALESIMDKPPAITQLASGAPNWPAGFRGSIAHSREVACAAATSTQTVVGIGLDVERIVPLDACLENTVCSAEERALFPAHNASEGASWPLIAFTIKEAIFKATHPVFGRFLEFDDVAVTLVPDNLGEQGRFKIERLGQGLHAYADDLVGRWLVEAEHVFSAVEFRRRSTAGYSICGSN